MYQYDCCKNPVLYRFAYLYAEKLPYLLFILCISFSVSLFLFSTGHKLAFKTSIKISVVVIFELYLVFSTVKY